jgi:hypothetical protein
LDQRAGAPTTFLESVGRRKASRFGFDFFLFLEGVLMKSLRFCLVTTAAMAIAAAGSLASATSLVDGGFENPITFDGPPFIGFWEGFNNGGANTGDATTTMPRTGLQSLELNLVDANGFAGAFQDVAGLVAGGEVTFGGWHKSLGESGGQEIRIEYRDSVNDVEISRTANFTPIVGTEWEEFSLTDIVPAGADTARAVYAIQSFGAGVSQQVFVDDTYFQVPEPASIALLGCAGLAIATLRRRRS